MTRVQSYAGLSSSSVAWGDADNDGDADLALTGVDGNGVARTLIGVNDGSGLLTISTADLPGGAFGRIVWGDDDGDGDLDLLVSGVANNQQNVVKILRNNGGVFTEAGAGLRSVLFAAADWGDYDNDGDLDILVAGVNWIHLLARGLVRVYQNNGGVYSEVAVLDAAFHGTAAWVDYDTDGDLDIFVSGTERVSGEVRAKMLQNNGGSFSPTERFGGGLFGDAALADYDDDGDVDVHLFGNFTTAGLFARQYRNEIAHTNLPPTAPVTPVAVPAAGSVSLSWGSASDAHTPSAGLTYNVRVGKSPGGNESPGVNVESSNWPPSGHRAWQRRSQPVVVAAEPAFGNILLGCPGCGSSGKHVALYDRTQLYHPLDFDRFRSLVSIGSTRERHRVEVPPKRPATLSCRKHP